MKMDKKKAQMWFTDFVIATFIFSFMLIGYYAYTTNISNRDSIVLGDLISDAESMSSSLLLSGFPDDWDTTNVQSIGITNNNQRINRTKFNEFMKIGYNRSKKLFGTTYDYILYFLNESGDIQNVEGFCGTGNPLVNISYNITAAYYYKGPGNDDFLKNFMESQFNADVYYDSSEGAGASEDLDALINNINNYGVIVLEAPEWSVGNEYNPFRAVAEPWVEAGGFLMISGELVSGQKKEMVGVAYEKDAGLSSPQEHATVVNEDEYLDFDLGESLIFDQGFTVEDAATAPPAVNFKDVVRFNESDIEFDDILDNKIAIARWNYGEGKVFFFSDFDTSYLAGDFQELLEASTKKWIGAMCLPINIDNIKKENLVRVERLLIYNSKPIKMVLYVWR